MSKRDVPSGREVFAVGFEMVRLEAGERGRVAVFRKIVEVEGIVGIHTESCDGEFKDAAVRLHELHFVGKQPVLKNREDGKVAEDEVVMDGADIRDQKDGHFLRKSTGQRSHAGILFEDIRPNLQKFRFIPCVAKFRADDGEKFGCGNPAGFQQLVRSGDFFTGGEQFQPVFLHKPSGGFHVVEEEEHISNIKNGGFDVFHTRVSRNATAALAASG